MTFNTPEDDPTPSLPPDWRAVVALVVIVVVFGWLGLFHSPLSLR